MKIKEILEKYNSLIISLEGGIKEFDIILSEISGINRFTSFLNPDYEIDDKILNSLLRSIKKRLENVPLSWVLNSHQFNDINIFIKSGVFVPRPETEYLAEMALKESFRFNNPLILDFCAGSGAIGIYLALKNISAKVFGIDKSKKAFDVMIENKKRFHIYNFTPIHSSKIDCCNIKFDIVVSNPPYVPCFMYDSLDAVVKKEPKSAIVSGKDGLNTIRYISKRIKSIINPGGVLLIEIGEYYTDKVVNIFKKISDNVYVLKDLNSKDRYLKVVF